jgi:hypothetical protein
MSGWIKLEKELREDRRFTRIVDALLARQNASVTSVTQMRFVERGVVTQVLGGLAQLWMFADSHIREDDTLDITLDEIDQLVGIEGFAKLMPSDWLEVLDEHRVRLPDFQAHNGTDAKKKALTAKRVKRHRTRIAVSEVTPEKRTSVTEALPDQTRLDQTRPDQETPSAPAAPTQKPRARTVSREADAEWFLDFKLVYPQRSGDPNWRGAQRAANARMREGHSPIDFIEGAERYAEFCRLTGKVGTEYVKQAATFLGPDKPFLQPWTPPSTKADTRLASNLSAADEFMRRTEVAQ